MVASINALLYLMLFKTSKFHLTIVLVIWVDDILIILYLRVVLKALIFKLLGLDSRIVRVANVVAALVDLVLLTLRVVLWFTATWSILHALRHRYRAVWNIFRVNTWTLYIFLTLLLAISSRTPTSLMSGRMLGLLLILDLYLIILGLPLLPLVFKVEAADYR